MSASSPAHPPQKSVLGKGLGSLLSGAANVPQQNSSAPAGAESAGKPTPVQRPAERQMGISLLPVDDIRPNEYQPRKDFDEKSIEELAQSIRENGLIQPLIVRRTDRGYELIAGERRLRACKLADLKMVPVVMRKSTDKESLELAILENIQREDLNCVDEALAYFRLSEEFGLSQEELAKRMGKDRATVSNTLRILKLSEPILARIRKKALSLGHAKALLAIENSEDREKACVQIVNLGMSVRQAEGYAQKLKQPKATTDGKEAASKPTSIEFASTERELSKRYMTRVKISATSVEFQYGSKDELKRILDQLLNS
jgi:ParB family transcriptional regulator, chromosome partitioning protein